MRIPNEDFLRQDWRVHALLSDIPLLDVWRVELPGGGPGLSIEDVAALIEGSNLGELGRPALALFWMREKIGALLGWDGGQDKAGPPPPESYYYRLSEADKAASARPSGTRYPPVTLLYQFEREALLETINASTQAYIHFSLQASAGGYTAHLAIYARNARWWSRYYMALIEPFRLWVVYPALLRTLRAKWAESYQ
jgi:hypothetical protein